MAENTTQKSGSGLYFVVGALVVAVLVVGFVAFGGKLGGGSDKINITIDPPKAELPKN